MGYKKSTLSENFGTKICTVGSPPPHLVPNIAQPLRDFGGNTDTPNFFLTLLPGRRTG